MDVGDSDSVNWAAVWVVGFEDDSGWFVSDPLNEPDLVLVPLTERLLDKASL